MGKVVVESLLNEKQVSKLANISSGKLQELRKNGILRPGIDYRWINGSSRMLRFPYPHILERLWELGIPNDNNESSAFRESTGRAKAANLDWGK